MLFFNIFGDDFRGPLPVKLRRYAEDAEKLHFYSKIIKLTDHFISCFFFWLMVKHLKSDPRKINYNFFKGRHKELSQNFSWHAAG